MSTKIWTAYKLIKTNYLWPFLHETREKALKNAKPIITSFLQEGTSKFDLYEKYRKAYLSEHRDEYDFDINLAIRNYKSKLYIIPYADMHMIRVLDFLKKDSRLVDFHYQNQTDHPKDISNTEWDNRGKTWNKMFNNWEEYLIFPIISIENFFTILWDIKA